MLKLMRLLTTDTMSILDGWVWMVSALLVAHDQFVLALTIFVVGSVLASCITVLVRRRS